MSTVPPDAILYLVLACLTTVAGVTAVSLDRFQMRSASAFAALGAVSPWLLIAVVTGPLAFHALLAPFLWIGLLGSWGFFMAATLAFLPRRNGPPNRGAAAASMVGVFAGGATAY